MNFISLSGSRWFTIILFHAALSNVKAQLTGVISAENGKPLSGCQVFINKSTFQSMTDEMGQFQLERVPAGFTELVVYKKGFQLYRASMRIQEERTYNLNLKLTELGKKPRGKSTPEELQQFKKDLLGDETLLTIEGEKQIQFLSENGQYIIPSGEPITIDYPTAGYRIAVYFSPTIFQAAGDAAYRYEEYQASNVKQNIAIEKARMRLFQGSVRHWLMALVVGKTAEEGFIMESDQKTAITAQHLITPATNLPGYFKIKIDQPITVTYKNAMISKVRANGIVDANKLGIMINSRILLIDGAMNVPGLASQLPTSYLPIAGDVESSFEEALNHFYEKIYIQTDKPYYYPGEPLWFKAYVNYYQAEWRDSLSDVLHIELFDSNRKLLLQKMYKIENGMAHGDMVLGDTLTEGQYYLRGHTNLRLNFGEENLFTRPLMVLDLVNKMDPTQQQPVSNDPSSTISPDKSTYKTREKINLTFHIKDAQGAPLGSNLSVSVTDAAQVIAIPETIDIHDAYPIRKTEIGKIPELTHRIERGVSFYGQFLNNKGKGEKTELTFIQWRTGDILSATTDDNGKFWQTGLQFTDSARFSYKSDKAKGNPYGKVIIPPRTIPELRPQTIPDLKVVKAGTIQRIISEYEVPKGNQLLDAIEVTAKRLDNSKMDQAKRSQNRADRSISGKNLNQYSNLLYSLVGKVPGLVVNPSLGTIYFARAQASSFTLDTNPLVTVNDIPMFGDPGTILQSIDPNIVESIGFTSSLASLTMYGSQGANGVISVYTKSGVPVDSTDPNFQTMKLPGFSQSRKFLAPDYANPKVDETQTDFRSTIYWNPGLETDAKTGTASVSFFAADLPGVYRIVAEGVTSEGKPIRLESYLTIQDRN